MTDNTYNYLLNDAAEAIAARQLSRTIASLAGAATLLKDAAAHDETEQLRSSYEMMLSYFAQGAPDPTREAQYAHFIARCRELHDRLTWLGAVSGSSHIASTYAHLKQEDAPAQALGGTEQAVAMDYAAFFDALALSGPLTSDGEKAVATLLADDAFPLERKCLAASALTLSCLTFFDARRLRLVATLMSSDNVHLHVRGLVGCALIAAVHRKRIDDDTTLHFQLEEQLRAAGLLRGDELEQMQMQLFLTLDTKRINKQLTEGIIPQIVKRLKDHKFDQSLNIADLDAELGNDDLNPQWASARSDEDLKKAFRSFLELQNKGADLYLGTFSNLCHRFRFFDAAANWFYPFTFAHPAMPEGARANPMTAMMLRADHLCDTDRYAFCLMADELNSAPFAALREKIPQEMLQGLGNQADASEVTFTAQTDPAQVMRAYVQAIYRFFQAYTFRSDYTNPFKADLFLGNVPPFAEHLLRTPVLEKLAAYAFDEQSYTLAADLYGRIPENEQSTECLQKLGYCLEALKQTDRALACYEAALLRDADSDWTLRRAAILHRKAGHYAEAELHLIDLEVRRPDDTDTAMLLAECFIHEGLYDEAFKRLFKVNYLRPDLLKAQRAIAWCSLLAGKYEQAIRHYGKILASDAATTSDHLNAGHAAWLAGDATGAITLYCQSAALCNSQPHDAQPWSTLFNDDSPMLLRAGKSECDLRMMADAVEMHTDKSANN